MSLGNKLSEDVVSLTYPQYSSNARKQPAPSSPSELSIVLRRGEKIYFQSLQEVSVLAEKIPTKSNHPFSPLPWHDHLSNAEAKLHQHEGIGGAGGGAGVERRCGTHRKGDAQHLEGPESILGAMQQNDFVHRVQIQVTEFCLASNPPKFGDPT